MCNYSTSPSAPRQHKDQPVEILEHSVINFYVIFCITCKNSNVFLNAVWCTLEATDRRHNPGWGRCDIVIIITASNIWRGAVVEATWMSRTIWTYSIVVMNDAKLELNRWKDSETIDFYGDRSCEGERTGAFVVGASAVGFRCWLVTISSNDRLM